MSDPTKASEWKIYSGQRAVPFTQGVGQHNYLVLVDPNGRAVSEIHGTAEGRDIFSAKLGLKDRLVEYHEDGTRMDPNPFGLGDEDRSNWVEVPSLKGRSALETWSRFKATADKYDEKFDYRFLPGGKALKFGSPEGQFYETMPSYNSNTAWRQILEENGYDWERYHPKEGLFEFSPGDGSPLPSLDQRRPGNARAPGRGPTRQGSRPNRAHGVSGPGDLLR